MKTIVAVLFLNVSLLQGQLLPLTVFENTIEIASSILCVDKEEKRIVLLDKSVNILYDCDVLTKIYRTVYLEQLPYEPLVPLKNLKRYICNIDFMGSYLVFNDNNVGKLIVLKDDLTIEKIIEIENFILNLKTIDDTKLLTVENTADNVELVLRNLNGEILNRKYLCESMLQPELIGMKFRNHKILISIQQEKIYILLDKEKMLKIYDQSLNSLYEFKFKNVDDEINCFTINSENRISLYSSKNKITVDLILGQYSTENQPVVFATYSISHSPIHFLLTYNGVERDD
jgi:hypothetical protein